mmetsp:Transcript_14735/g.30126  ORF Transcript_14735/g.30126 Transcript_14735/m.30126 type:complete len:333 (+) Transcript_14735:386-1384(+)
MPAEPPEWDIAKSSEGFPHGTSTSSWEMAGTPRTEQPMPHAAGMILITKMIIMTTLAITRTTTEAGIPPRSKWKDRPSPSSKGPSPKESTSSSDWTSCKIGRRKFEWDRTNPSPSGRGTGGTAAVAALPPMVPLRTSWSFRSSMKITGIAMASCRIPVGDVVINIFPIATAKIDVLLVLLLLQIIIIPIILPPTQDREALALPMVVMECQDVMIITVITIITTIIMDTTIMDTTNHYHWKTKSMSKRRKMMTFRQLLRMSSPIWTCWNILPLPARLPRTQSSVEHLPHLHHHRRMISAGVLWTSVSSRQMQSMMIMSTMTMMMMTICKKMTI